MLASAAKENHKRVPLLQSAKDARSKTVKSSCCCQRWRTSNVRKYAGTEVKYEGTEYLIVAAKDIIAVVE